MYSTNILGIHETIIHRIILLLWLQLQPFYDLRFLRFDLTHRGPT